MEGKEGFNTQVGNISKGYMASFRELKLLFILYRRFRGGTRRRRGGRGELENGVEREGFRRERDHTLVEAHFTGE